MKNVKTFLITLALFGLSVNAAYAENANALKATIQSFAHGGTGTLSASESGDTVTVTGNVTGATNTLAINIDAGVTVLWKADYSGTANFPDLLISLSNTGTFNVTVDGNIKNNGDSYAIVNDVSNSKIMVSGGTVNGGIQSRGNITVSSGTVISEKNIDAIVGYGNSSDNVTVSGGTITSSRDVITVFNSCNLVISGGVLNCVSIYSDNVINITGDPTVTVSGGMLLAKTGYAIGNSGTGTVTISGGIGFAYGTGVADVIDGAFTIPPVNSAALAAWNKAAGKTTYQAGTSDDIFVHPTTVMAVWANVGGVSGILGTLGFIPVEEVTVGTTGIETITNDLLQIYPNPTCDVLNFSIETPFEIIDLQGRILLQSGNAVKSANISSLPSGTYFVKITTEFGDLVKKVIKE